jgi:hypothetical protein
MAKRFLTFRRQRDNRLVFHGLKPSDSIFWRDRLTWTTEKAGFPNNSNTFCALNRFSTVAMKKTKKKPKTSQLTARQFASSSGRGTDARALVERALRRSSHNLPLTLNYPKLLITRVVLYVVALRTRRSRRRK